MPAPKSVTKLKAKNGSVEVEYTSDVDAAGYYIHELSRAAMRDVGKFLARTFKTAYYSHFSKKTGNAGRATKYKVGRFTKQDIRELCPSISDSSIEGAFRKLVEEGEIKREGQGKSITYYRLK